MKENLNFEKQMKKLLKSKLDEKTAQELPFVLPEQSLSWLNAVCFSLASKAVRGDIQAIKYINEICKEGQSKEDETPFSITLKVVE
ncbi:MAG: hypothetical protein RR198_01060 [Oscillospiraceae bacterium]